MKGIEMEQLRIVGAYSRVDELTDENTGNVLEEISGMLQTFIGKGIDIEITEIPKIGPTRVDNERNVVEHFAITIFRHIFGEPIPDDESQESDKGKCEDLAEELLDIFRKFDVCAFCRGSGQAIVADELAEAVEFRCSICAGFGRIMENKTK